MSGVLSGLCARNSRAPASVVGISTVWELGGRGYVGGSGKGVGRLRRLQELLREVLQA